MGMAFQTPAIAAGLQQGQKFGEKSNKRKGDVCSSCVYKYGLDTIVLTHKNRRRCMFAKTSVKRIAGIKRADKKK